MTDIVEGAVVVSVTDATQENNAAPTGVTLTKENIQRGLCTLGSHPITHKHTLLECNLSQQEANDIGAIKDFPNILYLNVSKNSIQSLGCLAALPYLVQLNASNNQLTDCLDFVPELCDKDNAWEGGHHAVGSMLTLADLSHNNIAQLTDLSRHRFLENLKLHCNGISAITGLSSLRFLQVLDLSFNNITKIEGLDDLQLRELNLKGNQITVLENLEKLSKLTYIDVSDNQLTSIAALSQCSTLTYIDARNNNIQFIRQAEYLREIPWLSALLLQGNPCFFKELYRLRVVYRLPTLKTLDGSTVSAEEKIRAFNLYQSPEGDLAIRAEVHSKYLPQEEFIDYSPYLFAGSAQTGVVGADADEEMLVDAYSLLMGYMCTEGPPEDALTGEETRPEDEEDQIVFLDLQGQDQQQNQQSDQVEEHTQQQQNVADDEEQPASLQPDEEMQNIKTSYDAKRDCNTSNETGDEVVNAEMQ